jgi:hypothetical protein
VERERATGPAAGLELAIAPLLAPEIVPAEELLLVIALVVAELEHDQAAVELEHDPVEAVLAQGHPHGRLAVALRTKSVTVAHRRGLVPLLAAEDLAVAAVETSLGPAATEAAGAWEAADTAAVGAAVAAAAASMAAEAEAVEAVEGVAAGGDEKDR